MKSGAGVLPEPLIFLEKLVKLEKNDLMAAISGRWDLAKLAKAGAELTIMAALSSKALLFVYVSALTP